MEELYKNVFIFSILRLESTDVLSVSTFSYSPVFGYVQRSFNMDRIHF